MTSCPTMKELQKFPVIFTFKIIGDTGVDFSKSVYGLFAKKEGSTFIERPSIKGKYTSISVTAEITNYEELESFYTEISKLEGIKFYV